MDAIKSSSSFRDEETTFVCATPMGQEIVQPVKHAAVTAMVCVFGSSFGASCGDVSAG